MKNTLYLIIIFFCIQINVLAQMKTGSKSIGGVFSISGTKTERTSTSPALTSSYVSIVPSIGFFLSDKFLMGGSLGYNSDNTIITDNWSQKNNKISFGAFAREHFKISESFAFFLQEDFKCSFGNEIFKYDVEENKYKVSGFFIGMNPGLIYFPSSRIGIESGFGSLYYQVESKKLNDSDEKTNYDSYGLTLDMSSLYFGFRYYF